MGLRRFAGCQRQTALCRLLSVGLAVAAVGCGEPGQPKVVSPAATAPSTAAQASAEPVPHGRLPADVQPRHYALQLEIDPRKESFSGQVDITVELQQARQRIWLHSLDLQVQSAQVALDGAAQPVAARLEQITPAGVAALTPEQPVGPGTVHLRLSYKAPFGRQLVGLYKVAAGGEWYAFTQLEPTYARRLLPCFDEPAFKTPFAVTVTASLAHQVIGNSQPQGPPAEVGQGRHSYTFAPTKPIPTYLLAFAVGPLDVVKVRPDIYPNKVRQRLLPLRGVAAKGRGDELTYALTHTGHILQELERYLGSEYPYDKLDIIAVPDKGGAMENVGAVTFSEWLLLVDPDTAPIQQERAFAYVMAHELAHMWFGNLVTMPYWDDLWLNEAFATWMGWRAVQAWRPEHQPLVSQLQGVERAMGSDSLISARQIRQQIAGEDDIHNAFDSITYQKGGAVLGMFERWLGQDVFQQGIRRYLDSHRFGTATADDLLAALSAAAGKDVATPFRTFLLQAGLPQLEVELSCGAGRPAQLQLRQSRYLPLGSEGDPQRTWQIPVCVRYRTGDQIDERCTLLSRAAGELELSGDGCPAWVMPNADAAGYYRWSLPDEELQKLAAASSELSVRERMSLGYNLWAAVARGSTDAAVALRAAAPLAQDPHPAVATTPMRFLRAAAEWLDGEPARAGVSAYGRKLYGPLLADLGWQPKAGESPERGLLRQEVISFLALSAEDSGVRQEAARRGKAYLGFGTDGKIHPEAVDPNLAGTALLVAAQQGDEALFDALVTALHATLDEVVRGRLLQALGSFRQPELQRRGLSLVLDERLKVAEVMTPIWAALDAPETRSGGWQWLVAHLPQIAARLPSSRAGALPWVMSAFCDREHAHQGELLFRAHERKLSGAPRNLAGALEAVRICVARKEHHADSFRAFFQAAK